MIDRLPTKRITRAHGEPRGERCLKMTRDQLRNGFWFFIGRKENGILATEFFQRRDVRAERGEMAERGFEQWDSESLFAAGEEERVCHAVKIGDDFVR